MFHINVCYKLTRILASCVPCIVGLEIKVWGNFFCKPTSTLDCPIVHLIPGKSQAFWENQTRIPTST